MTHKQAAELLRRAGAPIPADLQTSAEFIRNTRRKEVGGVVFRSTLEATAYQILQSWAAAGVITDLELQPKFLLQSKFRHEGKTVRAMTYKADFRFLDHRQTISCIPTVVEAKGHRTEAYKMRRKLFLAKYREEFKFEEWDKDTVRELQG